jgi:hypothetical protein
LNEFEESLNGEARSFIGFDKPQAR